MERPEFFATPGDWSRWLEKNHSTATEVLVGFYKKESGKPGITWPESVGEALCFGWIDGVRRSRDAASYTIRFTPRKATSRWSLVNVRKVKELIRSGQMRPAGLKAFRSRDANRTGTYSFEQRKDAKLNAAQQRMFRAHAKAWAFFNAQAPWYRRTATFWVVSAKQEATRQRRLETLIECSGRGQRIGPLTRKAADPSE